MMTEEQITKAMEEAQTLFRQKQLEVDQVVAEYNSKINELQKEGQAKINKLNEEIEQIRGEYTGYFRILHPDMIQQKPQPKGVVSNEQTVNKEVPVEEPAEEVNTIVEEEPQDVKAEGLEDEEKEQQILGIEPEVTNLGNVEQENQGLSEEELQKVQETLQKEQQPKKVNNKQPKQDDIPDYLKEEYNK